MKGLLIKDFCIIAKNKKWFGMLIFLGFFMFIMQGEEMGGFIISFVTMLGGSLVLTTISTDEFDKSTTFLMTLPIKRSTYAVEKYVFSFGCSLTCWLISTVISCILKGSGGGDIVKMAITILFVMSFFQMVMIPIQLKYGGENGRMVLIGIIVAIFGIGLAINKIGRIAFGEEEMQLWIQGMVRFLDALSPIPVMIAVVLGWFLLLWISIKISINVMKKREF